VNWGSYVFLFIGVQCFQTVYNNNVQQEILRDTDTATLNTRESHSITKVKWHLRRISN